ncbi:hypothetical protein ACJMK2_035609 [Sinanodonta woodiana]|uniref:CCHC-type domain-containing protein n=1 Tax=Sinanodonta woodiana TaxID=1069815 RepID=A0ABD3WXJ4_SINWO
MFRRFDVDLSPFVDKEIYQRTIRIEGRLSREDAMKKLAKAGVSISDVDGMYREGENSPWSAVLRTRELAKNITLDGIKYLANFTIDLRVHWLPLYVNDDIIREVLAPFGTVLDITRDKTLLDKDTATLNGTRLVKLNTTEFDSRHIPHIVSLGSCGMLITMKGRPPICLKCRQAGHLRKDCPEKSPSYASVATSRKAPAPKQSAVNTLKETSYPEPTITETSTPSTLPETTSAPAATTITETTPVESPTPTVEDTPTLTNEEVDIVASEEIHEGERRELFDADKGEWEVVSRVKRARPSPKDEENHHMEM